MTASTTNQQAGNAPTTTGPNPPGTTNWGPGPYSFGTLEAIWVDNGGAAIWAPTMAAIALLESGGDPNNTNPSGATGLWQVEWPLHSDLFPSGATQDTAKDPNLNAKAAVNILNGGAGMCSGWGPGTGDTIGTLVCQNGSQPLSFSQAVTLGQQYSSAQIVSDAYDTTSADTVQLTGWLQTIEHAIAAGIDPLSIIPGGGSAGTGLNPLGGLVGLENDLVTLVEDVLSPRWWKRIGIGALGVVLIVGGAILFISTTGTGKKIESMGTEAAAAAVAA